LFNGRRRKIVIKEDCLQSIGYRKITQSAKLSLWLTETCQSDTDWDDFVKTNTLGQFHQTSLWGMARVQDGWIPARVLVMDGPTLFGGFQVLTKWIARKFKVGYITKGPVFYVFSESVRIFTENIREFAKYFGHDIVFVQPPDRSELLYPILRSQGFLPNCLRWTHRANLVIDLNRDWREIENSFRKDTRQRIRQGLRRGVVIREGSEEDLLKFFNLMTTSARHQGETPSPPYQTLAEIYRQFAKNGLIRFTLAIHNNQALAGLISIAFGSSFTLWKKGWSGKRVDLRPNELLTYDAIKWAKLNRFETCDFGAIRPDTARALINGRKLSKASLKSSDYFNVKYGGRAVMLPPSVVLVRHPGLKLIYKYFILPIRRRRFSL